MNFELNFGIFQLSQEVIKVGYTWNTHLGYISFC